MNNKLRVLPAFQYSIKNYIKALAIFTGVMIAIYLVFNVLLSTLINHSNNVNVSGSSYEFAAFVFILVVGITSIREDLRMLIQHGMGRSTGFIISILCAMSTALLLAVLGEIITTISVAIASGYGNVSFVSWYQALISAESLSFGQHLFAVLINFSLYVCAYLVGMFITLVFYRLPKLWKLIVAIGIPAFFIIILPLLSQTGPGQAFFAALARLLVNMGNLIMTSTWYIVLFALIVAIILGILCKLLVRRISIQPASS